MKYDYLVVFEENIGDKLDTERFLERVNKLGSEGFQIIYTLRYGGWIVLMERKTENSV